MSTVDPCRMPHWLTPVCDDHPVSQPTSTWLPSRIHRCRVGTSPERSARRSTAWATPSSWMNTTPGTSVTLASFERRRACRAMRWSSHELSSTASSALTIVVTITRPMTTHNAVQNPSISTPGSRSSSRNTNSALRMMAPNPRVSTESGTTRNASAGHTTALAMPIDEPGQQRIPERVDREARQDGGEQPQPERGDDRDDDGAPQDRAPRRAVSGRADDSGCRCHHFRSCSLGRATSSRSSSDLRFFSEKCGSSAAVGLHSPGDSRPHLTVFFTENLRSAVGQRRRHQQRCDGFTIWDLDPTTSPPPTRERRRAGDPAIIGC